MGISKGASIPFGQGRGQYPDREVVLFMIDLTAKLPFGAPGEVQGQLLLPFELRQKRWLFAALVSGEEVAVKLARGATLRGGDRLLASDGRVIAVIAAVERLVHVECATACALAQAAYHLGNRHVAVQIGDGFLRLGENHVLEEMLRGLGATLTIVEAPFEPEAGAYSGTHSHDDPSENHPGRIHEFGTPERSDG
jgi:urease accessory protein